MRSMKIPSEVRALLVGSVGTAAHVEALVTLWRAAPSGLSLSALAAEARISPLSVASRCVGELSAAGLVEPSRDGVLRYAPTSAATREAVDGLAAIFLARPAALMQAIYRYPSTAKQSRLEARSIRRVL
jgi:hypothetical protein